MKKFFKSQFLLELNLEGILGVFVDGMGSFKVESDHLIKCRNLNY